MSESQAANLKDCQHLAGSTFVVHWSLVTGVAAAAETAAGQVLVALWPSPVNDDVCFRAAGFERFGDADAAWDAEAEALLARLLDELGTYGPPRLVSEPLRATGPWWYRRLFGNADAPPPLTLIEQLTLPIQWDSLPPCIVAFGEPGDPAAPDVTTTTPAAVLSAGSGHHLFWLTLPAHAVSTIPELVGRVAGPHPVVQTALRWEHLRTASHGS